MTQHADSRAELIAIIQDVRRRWRMKLALRGAALAAGCGAAALVLSAWGLQWMRFTPESILGFRIAIALVAGCVGYVFLVRPLMRSVSDEQVALYLEEHEPSLEAAIISAVEAQQGSGQAAQSPALVRKLVENAAEKCARSKTDGGSSAIRSAATPARSAACSRSPSPSSCSAPPTCATRCRRCW